MKKNILSIILSIFTFFCFSQEVNLQEICNKLSENKITKGQFNQIKTIKSPKGSRELKSSGDFIFSLDGIMWKTLKPFPSTMVVGTDYLVQISADGKKTVTDTSSNQVFGSVAQTITAVFSNDYSMLTNAFNTSLSRYEENIIKVELSPKDSTIASVLGKIILSVQPVSNSYVLNSIEMQESSGNKTIYNFLNQEYPKELTQDEKANFIYK